jgi:hypothetical protein
MNVIRTAAATSKGSERMDEISEEKIQQLLFAPAHLPYASHCGVSWQKSGEMPLRYSRARGLLKRSHSLSSKCSLHCRITKAHY